MANAWETDEDIERHSAGDNKAGLAYKNPLAQQEPGDAAGRLKMDCGDVYYIAVTSLLQQFSVVKVRGDFITGKFSMRGSPQLLDQLDELRCLLQPQWLGGGFTNNAPRCQLAAQCFDLLSTRSDDILPLKTGTHRKYCQWFELITGLANDPYWSQVDPKGRCTHKPVRIDTDGSASAGGHVSNRSGHSKSSKNSQSNRSSKSSGKSSTASGRKTAKKAAKIEEIVISDSSDNNSSSSSSVLSSGSSSSPQSHRRSRRRTKVIKKSIVTPPNFEVNGKMSLGEFLDDYESFFDRKYSGNKYEKTQVLESFLTGELLQIYKIRGGRRLKFKEMKQHLLTYYKDKRIGTRKYWRKQLEAMAPEPTEPFDMFGLRLLETAKLGYSRSSEAAEEVRKPFLSHLPEYIRIKIKDAEMLNAAQGHGKHLPFKSLMVIAKQSQMDGVKPKTVMWSSSAAETQPDPQPVQPMKNGGAHFEKPWEGKKAHRKRNSPSPPANQRTRSVCYHCNNKGHKKADCWIRMGRCRICGGPHRMEDCPRYDPDYCSKSRPRHKQENPNHQPLN